MANFNIRKHLKREEHQPEYIKSEENKDIDVIKTIKSLEKEIEDLKSEFKLLKEKYEDNQDKPLFWMKPREKQITDEQIKEIKRLKKQGLSYSKIEKSTGWSKATISRVLNGMYE